MQEFQYDLNDILELKKAHPCASKSTKWKVVRMGADIKSDSRSATFHGVKKLHGAPISACDLRAGAAFIIAGLMAEGVTEIDNIRHIQRGYEDIVGKLKKVGADIELRFVPDEAASMNNAG